MGELINTDLLGDKNVSWFYRVTVHVMAINENGKLENDFEHSEDFKGVDLIELRKAAILYYNSRVINFPKFFFYKFISPSEWMKNHALNQNKSYATFSIGLSFVCLESDGFEDEYYIEGESEEVTQISEEYERSVYNSLGLSRPFDIKRVSSQISGREEDIYLVSVDSWGFY